MLRVEIGQMNPQRVSQKVRHREGLNPPLESHVPGVTREEFYDFLKRACRKVK